MLVIGTWWICLSCFFVILAVLLKFNYPTILYHIHKENAHSLPYPSNNFVGREEEIAELTSLLDFTRSTHRIVHLYGSPGIGKSALANEVGHRMLEKGVTVHYINLVGYFSKLHLAEKIFESSGGAYKNIDFHFYDLLLWVREKAFYNLIIIDDCDEYLEENLEDFYYVL